MNAESAAELSREELIALVGALRAHIAELERRLGLNSSNSGKPPSSDGLKKPARVSSLRERSGKKPGGQKCHKGETLRQVTDPDEGVNAPVQYGARITAFVIYLLHYQLLPENRLAALMADLFGVKVAAATIARMSRTCAERLQGFVATVRELVAGAPVKHMDETGFRIGGKTQWLHVASTALLTFYWVCAKRGSLLAHVAGIVVHDHWKPYYTMQGVRHALCNAHHLRELKALVEIEKEEWARKMQRLLRRACHVTNRARDRGIPMKPRFIESFERHYDTIIAEGFLFHEAQAPLVRTMIKGGSKPRGRTPRRTGHNLLLRLATRKEDTLRFLHNATVPFTNNQAERDGRMMKLRQKISGGFRSLQGAMDFALIRSFFATARKHDWNIIDALNRNPLNLAKSLRLS